MLNRSIFAVRPYDAPLQRLQVSAQEYGNHVRKINFFDEDPVTDKACDLQDGQSVDMYEVHKPKVLQTNYYGQTNYSRVYTQADSQLKAAEATRNLEIQTQFAKAKDEALEEAKNTVGEEWRLKYEQLEKQHNQTKDALETAKRRSEQGSQQIQGEVLEDDICSYLTEAFHDDEVSRVKKGRAGADVIQKVRRFQQECGTIVWEVKNAKWNRQWISKLKGDVASASADVGILVSVNVPEEVDSFGFMEGILVTKPSYVIPIATVIRSNLMAMRELNISLMGRDERMNRLQEYITGPDFLSRISMIAENFKEMREELEAEKRATMKRWAKQEKRLDALAQGTVSMYGDFQGILGKAVEDIPLLEQEDDELLE